MSNIDYTNSKEPVLLIRDGAGQLISVGHPTSYKGAEITKYLKSFHTLETITIDEYRKKDLKLYTVN